MRLLRPLRGLVMTWVFAVLISTLIFGTAYGDVLFGKDYYETLRKYIAQAEKSIVVAMYLVIIEEESPVNVLVDELITAKKRGVVLAIMTTVPNIIMVVPS